MKGYRIGTGVATATLVTTLFGGYGPGAPAQLDLSFTVDFEDAPANRSGSPAAPPITDRYADLGLIFDTPVTPLVYDDESVPALSGFAHSGSTVITTCYSAEFCSNEVVLRLDPPHARVGLRVGYQDPLPAPAELVVTGHDGDERIATDRIVLGPSDEPIPVDALLTLVDDAGRLTRVEVRWADPSRFLGGLAIDDIELVPFVPRVEVVASPEALQLDARQGPPTERVVFSNVGDVDVAIADVALQLTGDDAREDLRITDSTCAGLLPPEGSCEVLVTFDPADGADDVAGAVTLVTRDGQRLVGVRLEGVAPQVQVPGSPGGEGEGEGETERNGGADDSVRWFEVPDWLSAATGGWSLAVLLLLGLIGAVRRIARRRKPPEPTQPVRCRLIDDAGTQTIEHRGRTQLAIRASTVPQRERISIEGGAVVREVVPP